MVIYKHCVYILSDNVNKIGKGSSTPMCQLILLVAVLIQVAFSKEIELAFLTAVPRLESNTLSETTNINMTIDYYFSCNVVGRFLQWEYNNEPLSGFRMDEIGSVLLDERTDYTYTATLLSSQPVGNNQATIDSVLVMSFSNGTDPGQFMTTCSSNLNIMSTTAGNLSHVKNSNESGEVRLDYVVSDNIVSNRAKTHIFMCGVRHTPQFIEVAGPILGFTRFDDVGRARNVYLEDQHTADVQGILITRETYQAVVLIFVASNSDLVNVSCYDSFSSLMLQSREKDEQANIPEQITYAILDTTVNQAGSFAENSMKPVTMLYTVDIGTSENISFISSIISTMLTSVMAVVIVVIVMLCHRIYAKKRQKKRAVTSLTKYNGDAGEHKNLVPSMRGTSIPEMSTSPPMLSTCISETCTSTPTMSTSISKTSTSTPMISTCIPETNTSTLVTNKMNTCTPPLLRAVCNSTPEMNVMNTSTSPLGVKYNSAPVMNEMDTSTGVITMIDKSTPIPLLRVVSASSAAINEIDNATPLLVVTNSFTPVLFTKNYDGEVISNSDNGSGDCGICDYDVSLKANQCHDETRKSFDSSDVTSGRERIKVCDQGDTSSDEVNVCLDVESLHEYNMQNNTSSKSLSKEQPYTHEPLFGFSVKEVSLDDKTIASIPENTLPQAMKEIDDDRKNYTSQEIQLFFEHMLYLSRNEANSFSIATIEVGTKIKCVMRCSYSKPFTPIFNGGNAFAVYINCHHDKEESNAYLTSKELKKGNAGCENDVMFENVSDEKDGNDERVEDEAIQCGSSSIIGINDNKELGFHHSASSALLAETDTTPLSKMVYCFIMAQGFCVGGNMSTFDDPEEDYEFSSELSRAHDVVFEMSEYHKYEQKILIFSAECDAPVDIIRSSDWLFVDSLKTEELYQAPYYRNGDVSGSADMVIRRRLKKTE